MIGLHLSNAVLGQQHRRGTSGIDIPYHQYAVRHTCIYYRPLALYNRETLSVPFAVEWTKPNTYRASTGHREAIMGNMLQDCIATRALVQGNTFSYTWSGVTSATPNSNFIHSLSTSLIFHDRHRDSGVHQPRPDTRQRRSNSETYRYHWRDEGFDKGRFWLSQIPSGAKRYVGKGISEDTITLGGQHNNSWGTGFFYSDAPKMVACVLDLSHSTVCEMGSWW